MEDLMYRLSLLTENKVIAETTKEKIVTMISHLDSKYGISLNEEAVFYYHQFINTYGRIGGILRWQRRSPSADRWINS